MRFSTGHALILALLTGSAAVAQAPASTVARYDGAWHFSMDRSGPHRTIRQVVTIAHIDGIERYSTEVTFEGQRSGIRYEARYDGRPHPFFDLVTGEKRGMVTLVEKAPGVVRMTMQGAQDGMPPSYIEHWLSNDGRSFTSLLLDKEGIVKDVLLYEK
jgi:hypothetical protein